MDRATASAIKQREPRFFRERFFFAFADFPLQFLQALDFASLP